MLAHAVASGCWKENRDGRADIDAARQGSTGKSRRGSRALAWTFLT